jgi:hypothetical protein
MDQGEMPDLEYLSRPIILKTEARKFRVVELTPLVQFRVIIMPYSITSPVQGPSTRFLARPRFLKIKSQLPKNYRLIFIH